MSASDVVICITMTAILSPLVCFTLYVVWKGHREVKKGLRRIEIVRLIEKDWEVQKVITDLIIAKIKDDYFFQQAIEQLQKKTLTSFPRKEA